MNISLNVIVGLLLGGGVFLSFVRSERFFVGNYISNVTTSCQVNMYQTYIAIGVPGSLVQENVRITMQPVGNDTYYLTERAITTNPPIVIQEVWFQLDNWNLTALPGNVTARYRVQVYNVTNLRLEYDVQESGNIILAEFHFDPTFNTFVSFDLVPQGPPPHHMEDPVIEGQRNYIREAALTIVNTTSY